MTVQQVNIDPVNEHVLELKIKGLTGLICHNFSEKSRKEMRDKHLQIAKGPRGVKDIEGEYEAAFYHLEGGGYGFPCSAFRNAAIRAAKSVNGMTMIDTSQWFFVLADDRDTTNIDCVKIDCKKVTEREDVVRLKGGAADLRYRPELIDWSAPLNISYDADMISPDMLANLFQRAGYSVGVGDWRPERKGTAGRFSIAAQESAVTAEAA